MIAVGWTLKAFTKKNPVGFIRRKRTIPFEKPTAISLPKKIDEEISYGTLIPHIKWDPTQTGSLGIKLPFQVLFFINNIKYPNSSIFTDNSSSIASLTES